MRVVAKFAGLLIALLVLRDAQSDAHPMGSAIHRVHYVLIGADASSDGSAARLRGVPSDIAIVKQAVSETLTSLSASVTVLSGELATRAAILDALTKTLKQAGDGEPVVLYWSGHTTMSQLDEDVMLIPFDFVMKDKSNAIYLSKDIAPLSSPRNPLIFVGDGCSVGDGMAGRLSLTHPTFSALSSTKSDELAYDAAGGTSFATAFAEAISKPADDLDGDGYVSVEEVHHYIYPIVAGGRRGREALGIAQHPTVAGNSIHRILLAKKNVEVNAIEIDDSVASDATVSAALERVNGQQVTSARFDKNRRLLTLSDKDKSLLQSGINVFQTTAGEISLWLEKRKLRKFQQPYGRSRAVIVAIDDYGRMKDPKARDPSGLAPLGEMVSGAQRLKQTLMRVGFNDADIHTVYNDAAESDDIERLLKDFWAGGKYEDTDRLFVYFGGHGVDRNEQAWFASYDYDEQRPMQSTVSISDLMGRYAKNFKAKHVFMAFDACHAGLGLPETLSDDNAIPADAELQRLTLISGDVMGPTRNFFVSGTGGQEAVYQNGGIFTQSLAEGIDGSADLDKDGIVQLHELAVFVRKSVAIRARQTQIQQIPKLYVPKESAGQMLFIVRGPTAE